MLPQAACDAGLPRLLVRCGCAPAQPPSSCLGSCLKKKGIDVMQAMQAGQAGRSSVCSVCGRGVV